MRDLETYRKKRDPARTPEPFGEERPAAALAAGAARRFVVQQHAARRLHYDLRLEIDGVLASWAVPKGPSLDPKERRLAVRTEDHPLEYEGFEGVIPAGSYGAGAMIVWDAGTYRTLDGKAPAEGLAGGKLDLELSGHKLRGRFALVRTRNERDWLLLRKGTAPAGGGDPVRDEPASVLSGLRVEEVRAGASRDADVEAALRRLGAPARALDRAALRPTLARTAPAPFSRPGWLFELKYDGVRALAVKAADGGVQLVVRTGADRAAVYPEVTRAVARLPLSSFAIDGELVALDGAGRSSFERIQRRMGLRDPREIARAAVDVPVVYYAFDLLGALGRDARALPLVRRKELLARFAPQLGVVRFADHLEGDGARLFEAVAAHGLEGVIAKKSDAPYASGRRTDHWLKIKAPRTACAAIVGWTAGQGGRARLGALLLGWWRGGELVYAGSVGSGLDERTIDALLPALEAARVPEPACVGVPEAVLRSGRFVRPERACEVRYTEETSAGLLRQPVFVRLRELDPAACSAPAAREAAEPAASAGAAKPAPSAGTRKPAPSASTRKPAPSAGTRKPSLHAGAPKPPPTAPDPGLQLTRLDKVFWPLEGYTKGDLLAYYEAVWPWLTPYLRDRPLVLTRYPDGIEGKSFYQHQAPPFTPDWVRRARIDDTDYFLCDDLRSLLYVVNSGAIPLHVWSAQASALEHPDWLVIDLDPKGAPFAHVALVARRLHRLLDEGGAAHFVKTSGQDGLHVLVPLAGQLDHEQARALGEVLARAVCAELPEIATIARPIASRGGRVYVDYLQNGRGKTIVAPLSVRPRPGAPVSMPLAWSEVNARLAPARFTIETAPARLARSGDPLAGALGAGVDVARLLAALEGYLGRAGAAPEPPPRPRARPSRRPARGARSAAKKGRTRR